MFILLGPSTKKSINRSPPRKTYQTKLNNSFIYLYMYYVWMEVNMRDYQTLHLGCISLDCSEHVPNILCALGQ